jgi:hemoglobin-like flavoprotein
MRLRVKANRQMIDRDFQLFNDSYERCIRNPRAPGFLNRFYELVLASSDEVAEKFKNTDSHKQTHAIKASLYYLLMACSGAPEAMTHLERIADLHSRTKLDIRPELYDVWLACLLQAVREYDAFWNAEREAAWRRVLAFGIEFMRSKY